MFKVQFLCRWLGLIKVVRCPNLGEAFPEWPVVRCILLGAFCENLRDTFAKIDSFYRINSKNKLISKLSLIFHDSQWML